MSKAFLVIGATGKQGGAVVRSLIAQPGFSPTSHTIYGLTRDIQSGSAKRLADLSPAIKPIQGNLSDAGAIFRQLDPKPWGVFVVSPLSSKETENCNAIIDAAVAAGARHIVFSGVDRGGPARSDADPTVIPHFITKHNVERHLRDKTAASAGALTHTILRPVFFLDNLLPGFFGKVTATAWRDVAGRKTTLQVVDTRDVGEFGAMALWRSEEPEFKDQAISLAGDELTFDKAQQIWTDKLGEKIPTTLGLAVSGLMAVSKELSTMFRWFKSAGFGADIKHLNTIKPMTTFEQWIDREMVGRK